MNFGDCGLIRMNTWMIVNENKCEQKLDENWMTVVQFEIV